MVVRNWSRGVFSEMCEGTSSLKNDDNRVKNIGSNICHIGGINNCCFGCTNFVGHGFLLVPVD